MSTRSQWIIDKSEAVASGGMVTAMQPDAAEAGAEILRRGGSAIDAAVATAFAVGVVEPFMSGVGGLAFMIYRDGATGETVCLDGSAMLPSAISPDLFELLPGNQTSGLYGWRATVDDAANTGWLTPAMPGMPALCDEAHQRWGRLDWGVARSGDRSCGKRVRDQSLRRDDDGRSLRPARQIPESKRTFFKESGAPYSPALGRPADRLVQKDLARTLGIIAKEGARTVYDGEIAELIAKDMARNGGVMTVDDLSSHRTLEYAPSSVDYRGYQILGQLPNTGDATVMEALQIALGYDLAGLGFQSPEAVHIMIESIRRAFLDRLRWLGDESLQPVPYDGVISSDYGKLLREGLDPKAATPDIAAGDPWPFDPEAGPDAPPRPGAGGEGHTTHINVIDKDRNMVSLTSTLGAVYGSGVVIKDTGITLNNGTMWFDPEPGAVTSVGPNKRVLSAASPALMMRDGQPFAAIGAPGGRRVISGVYQIVSNLVDFQRGMQGSISAPRIHSEGPAVEISTRFPETTIEGLRKMGHDLTLREDSLSANHFARPSGIMIDAADGLLRAGVHQYTPATAIGV
ncbi:MAG: gamma-glutamyltransferase family protein [Thermomicrobiales bacterium]